MSHPVEILANELIEALDNNPYNVFLCGPSMRGLTESKEKEFRSSELRALISENLKSSGFEVILGEDERLSIIQNDHGIDAQSSELQLFERSDATVLIAESNSTFAELGLFSHNHATNQNNRDFILIINESYKNSQSYITLGPVALIEDFGKVIYLDLSKTDEYQKVAKDIEKRLKSRRSVLVSRKKNAA